MYTLLVTIQVKPECLDAFKAATQENALHSRKEQGVRRFDVLQQMDDPTRFVLIEEYRAPEDHAAHRETAHYKRWRDTVEHMMAVPRVGIKYGILQ